MGALGLGLTRFLRFDRVTTSAFLLSILFVNAGNYGIPFNQFAFGPEGVARAAVYFVGNSVLANTLAVYIASSGHANVRNSLVAVAKMPLAYAAVLGLLFNVMHWSTPEPLTRVLDLAAAAALPVMLVNLGLELARARVEDYDWRVFLATGLKLLVTPVVALGLAAVMGLQGLTRSVAVLEASMPTAVMASLIAFEFDARSEVCDERDFPDDSGQHGDADAVAFVSGLRAALILVCACNSDYFEPSFDPVIEITLLLVIFLALGAAIVSRWSARELRAAERAADWCASGLFGHRRVAPSRKATLCATLSSCRQAGLYCGRRERREDSYRGQAESCISGTASVRHVTVARCTDCSWKKILELLHPMVC